MSEQAMNTPNAHNEMDADGKIQPVAVNDSSNATATQNENSDAAGSTLSSLAEKIQASSRTTSSLAYLSSLVRVYPDFPSPGILFRDVFPIFTIPSAVDCLINCFVEHINSLEKSIDVIAGLDARGFLIGPLLGQRLRLPFVPVRKVGKLPGRCFTATFQKEYGPDSVVLAESSIVKGQHVLLVDDLLATGGTLNGAIQVVELAGGIPIECLVMIELNSLNGRQNLSIPVHSLLQY